MVIQLIAKDKKEKLQFEEKCKITINPFSQLLIVEPENEEFKMISAMFNWNFFADKAVHGNAQLIRQRFLPTLLTQISINSAQTVKVKEILVDWINKHQVLEREKLIQLLKDNNVYDLCYPKDVERGNPRKRKAKDISYEMENNDEDVNNGTTGKNVNKYKLPYNKMEILTKCRMLLRKRYKRFCLPCKPSLDEECITGNIKDYAHQVRNGLLKLVNVESPDNIPLCIWRTICLSDIYFKNVVMGLALLKNDRLEKALTKIPKTPDAMKRILTDPTVY
uniref:Uncharacterized protein n=1 Tax=Panagrolaimus sp. ES5 TaxID=591445 RepID=A0AC34FJ57_9BILA